MATVTLTARYLDQLKQVFDTLVPGFAIRADDMRALVARDLGREGAGPFSGSPIRHRVQRRASSCEHGHRCAADTASLPGRTPQGHGRDNHARRRCRGERICGLFRDLPAEAQHDRLHTVARGPKRGRRDREGSTRVPGSERLNAMPGTRPTCHAFQACSIDHSDISPFRIKHLRDLRPNRTRIVP